MKSMFLVLDVSRHFISGYISCGFVLTVGLSCAAPTQARPNAKNTQRASNVAQSGTRTHLTTGQLIAKVSPSVVSLTVFGQNGKVAATGSGFVIGKNMIATNFHVIAGAHIVNANFPGGRSEPVPGVLDLDVNHDLVVLLVNTQNLPVLAMGTTPIVGDNVIAIGSPEDLSNSVSTGIVSGIRVQQGTKVIQTTAPLSHGSSGGPLLNEDGRVIGITSSSLVNGQNLNFAISIGYLHQIIPSKINTMTSWQELESSVKAWHIGAQDQEAANNNPQTANNTIASDSDDAEAKQRRDEADTAFALGNTFFASGKYEEAIIQYRKAIQANPGASEAHYNLALALRDQGKLDQALDEFVTAEKINPEDSDTHMQLAHLYNDIKLYDKAIVEANSAIKSNPKSSSAYFQRGFALSQQGNDQNAELAFRNALRWDNKDASSYNNLGLVLLNLNRRVEARQQWQKVLTLDDKDEVERANRFLAEYPETPVPTP